MTILYSVILFPSTSHALRAEKILQQKDVVTKLIPVPRQLSSDCGVCLRFERDIEPVVRQILAEAGVAVEDICEI
jgi:hypothetical protein